MNDQKRRLNSASRYHYLIIQCYACGRPLLAKTGQRTKVCTYCGTRLDLRRVKMLSRARSAREASQTLRAIKERSRPRP